MTELYNLPNIRELLTNGFTDAELRALCFDLPGFRPVYDQLAQNTGTAEIVAKLLEHAEKTLQLNTLLALAKEKNSARYEKHQPYYQSEQGLIFKGQVIDTTISSPVGLPIPLTREQQYQITLYWAELGRRHNLARFDLSETDLRAVDLSGADLRGANLERANLAMADLSEADLRMANLTGANLTEANLRRANLRLVNLRFANLYRSNLKDTDLRNANVASGSSIIEDYPTAVQRQMRTNLTEANMEGAKLCQTNLFDANLSAADLRIAFLYGTNLSMAWLKGANLDQAKYGLQTKWPKGFDPDKAGAICKD